MAVQVCIATQSMEYERQALAATLAPYAAELCNGSHSMQVEMGELKECDEV
jgi:hypothetical protein